MASYINVYNYKWTMFRWILLFDYFSETTSGLGGLFQYWNCSPGSVNHTLVHGKLRQHLHLSGANGGLRVLPEWRWNVGLVGPSINSQNRINWPLNFTLEIINNFWNTPKYHFLKGRWYGEWTPAWGLAILRFLLLMVLDLDQSSERSPSNFQGFQNGVPRVN